MPVKLEDELKKRIKVAAQKLRDKLTLKVTVRVI